MLYDSVNAFDIPANVEAVAGYVDGIYAWGPDSWARFATSFKLRIAVRASTNDGHALDVETGNASPSEVPGWVARRHAAGVQAPWIYCNRVNRPNVEAALAGAQIPPSDVALWIATLDGTRTVPAGPYPIAAVQWASPAISGGHYDISDVNADYGAAPGVLEGPVQSKDFPDDFLVTLHHLLQLAAFGVIDPSGQQDFVNTVHAGSGINTIFDGWLNTPASQAYRNGLRAAAAGGTAADDDSAFVTKTALKRAIDGL